MPWCDDVEVRRGDVTVAAEIDRLLVGQDVAYYLVHSLTRRDFVDVDQRAASAFAKAAREGRLRRLVFLGGIVPDGPPLSAHLPHGHRLVGSCSASAHAQSRYKQR